MSRSPEQGSLTRTESWPAILGLTALGLLLVLLYGLLGPEGPALVDEYIYLSGARYFADTSSLDARFYSATALLDQGYPHQDMHSPGYVLLLGSAMRVFGHGYGVAVGLNAAAYIASSLLLYLLCRELGAGGRQAWLSGALQLLLPVHLPYVFWVLPEVIVGTLLLATLVAASRWGKLRFGAILPGLLFGLGFLVRESTLFGLPAALVLAGRKRSAFLLSGTAALFILLVHVPLARERAQGGTNFWRATSSENAFEFDVLNEGARGNLGAAVRVAWQRASSTLSMLAGRLVSATERGILITFLLLSAWPLCFLRSSSGVERRFLGALLLGWSSLLLVMLSFFEVPPWSAPRYLMFLMPPFLYWVGRAPVTWSRSLRWSAPIAAGLLCVALNAGTLENFSPYIESRKRRQLGQAEYVAKYIDPLTAKRILLENGYLFGLRHYPIEVVVSLPEHERMAELERALWMDYVVLPGDWPRIRWWDRRLRYERVNADDAEADLRIYRRLR